jgi:hypothetical protein
MEKLRRGVKSLKPEKVRDNNNVNFLEQNYAIEGKSLKKQLDGLKMEHNNAKSVHEELKNL